MANLAQSLLEIALSTKGMNLSACGARIVSRVETSTNIAGCGEEGK
jgi:hypothetical protein